VDAAAAGAPVLVTVTVPAPCLLVVEAPLRLLQRPPDDAKSPRVLGWQAEGSASGLPDSSRPGYRGSGSSDAGDAGEAASGSRAGGKVSHYVRLGVAPSAGGGEIRRAYWRQATLTHPDKGGSDGAFAQARALFPALLITE